MTKMGRKAKELVQGAIGEADLFQQFLVEVIPALREFFRERSARGVAEAAKEFRAKLGVKFEEAREAIAEKHADKPEGPQPG